MSTNKVKYEHILSQIGLKTSASDQSGDSFKYSEFSFKRYVTEEYRNSERRDNDEFYRMFEFELLHKDSGLRIVYSTSTSYDGESTNYNLIGLYILDLSKNKLNVVDVDFVKRVFYTKESILSFDATSKTLDF